MACDACLDGPLVHRKPTHRPWSLEIHFSNSAESGIPQAPSYPQEKCSCWCQENHVFHQWILVKGGASQLSQLVYVCLCYLHWRYIYIYMYILTIIYHKPSTSWGFLPVNYHNLLWNMAHGCSLIYLLNMEILHSKLIPAEPQRCTWGSSIKVPSSACSSSRLWRRQLEMTRWGHSLLVGRSGPQFSYGDWLITLVIPFPRTLFFSQPITFCPLKYALQSPTNPWFLQGVCPRGKRVAMPAMPWDSAPFFQGTWSIDGGLSWMVHTLW